MWSKPMLRVEMYSTPASFNARSIGPEISDLWPTLMHRLPGTEMTLASDTAALVIVGTTPKRGDELVEQVRLVLLAAVDGDARDAASPLHPADRAWGRRTWPGNRDRRLRGAVRSARVRCRRSGTARTRHRVRTATPWRRSARCRPRPRTRAPTCWAWPPIGRLPRSEPYFATASSSSCSWYAGERQPLSTKNSTPSSAASVAARRRAARRAGSRLATPGPRRRRPSCRRGRHRQPRRARHGARRGASMGDAAVDDEDASDW